MLVAARNPDLRLPLPLRERRRFVRRPWWRDRVRKTPGFGESGSRSRALAACLASGVTYLPSCVPVPAFNPLFPTTTRGALFDLRRMRARPVPLERPVVVLGGYHEPGPWAEALMMRLRAATSQDPHDFLAVDYLFKSDAEDLIAKVVTQVDEKWPNASRTETIEIDAVAISMGGLIARAAAIPPERNLIPGDETLSERQAAHAETASPGDYRKRLRIRRLFTLATPHRGAKLADAIAPDNISRAMRTDSPWICGLNGTLGECEYELFPYAILRDGVVGARNAAPPGREPFWVSGTLIGSHMGVSENRRIAADIARRLRGERPLAIGPSRPPND